MHLVHRARTWSWSARLGVFSLVGMLGVVAAMGIFFVASQASEQRGHGADVSRALGKSSRLALAGLAFDQWMDAPSSAREPSYRYLVVKNWDDETLPVWMGNPETVHNEYLQVLADYGLIGFLLVMAFALLMLGRVVLPPQHERRSPLIDGLKLGAAGGLVGTMVHATVEFQLHLLPILLLVAIAIGDPGAERGRRFGAADQPCRIGFAGRDRRDRGGGGGKAWPGSRCWDGKPTWCAPRERWKSRASPA